MNLRLLVRNILKQYNYLRENTQMPHCVQWFLLLTVTPAISQPVLLSPDIK